MIRYDCLDEYPRFVAVAHASPMSYSEISADLDALSTAGFAIVHDWASGRSEHLPSVESVGVFAMTPEQVDAVVDARDAERAKPAAVARRIFAGVFRFIADHIDGGE